MDRETERDRDRERQRQKQKHRQRERERERQTDRQRERESRIVRQRQKVSDGERQTDGWKLGQTEGGTGGNFSYDLFITPKRWPADKVIPPQINPHFSMTRSIFGSITRAEICNHPYSEAFRK